jgi:hypothetical protein
MAHPVSDRRVDTRVTSPIIDTIGMTLRPGNDVILVDLCVHGARVHSSRPLRPGARARAADDGRQASGTRGASVALQRRID